MSADDASTGLPPEEVIAQLTEAYAAARPGPERSQLAGQLGFAYTEPCFPRTRGVGPDECASARHPLLPAESALIVGDR
jgi:hypothetical protein